MRATKRVYYYYLDLKGIFYLPRVHQGKEEVEEDKGGGGRQLPLGKGKGKISGGGERPRYVNHKYFVRAIPG